MNKRLITIMLTIFLLILILSLSSGCKKELEPQFLRVVGKDIVTNNGNGEVILLRGVNAGGWLVVEEWMCPVNSYTQYEMEDTLYERFGEDAQALLDTYMDNWWKEEDFDNVKAMGLNLIRLPFLWRTLQNTDYTYKDNAFDRIDWFINEASKRDLYVILDLHGAHGSQNGRHHSGDVSTGGDLYTNEENMTLTEELWVTIASRYKDNPTVAGYDLLNEPEGVPDGVMNINTPHWDYYDRLYKAIRAVDNNHIIIMESIWESYNLPNPTRYNWENVVYQYHFYGWNNYSDYNAQKSFIDQKVIYSNLSKHNVPEFIGEFSFFNNVDSWEYGLSVFQEQGWSYSMWTYKITGNSSWGIYYNDDSDIIVNLDTDSYDDIMSKWSRLSTNDNFIRQQWLYDVLSIREE